MELENIVANTVYLKAREGTYANLQLKYVERLELFMINVGYSGFWIQISG